ncbi:hypothetical protein ACIBSV_09315 [Embleya sp. NPDC050154]|uniref:hypothetical protein n=2 Tax=unclassified Embleya TaxID=2699296 RepID=UPI00379BD265
MKWSTGTVGCLLAVVVLATLTGCGTRAPDSDMTIDEAFATANPDVEGAFDAVFPRYEPLSKVREDACGDRQLLNSRKENLIRTRHSLDVTLPPTDRRSPAEIHDLMVGQLQMRGWLPTERTAPRDDSASVSASLSKQGTPAGVRIASTRERSKSGPDTVIVRVTISSGCLNNPKAKL